MLARLRTTVPLWPVLPVLAALMVCDSALFTAISPLLPRYVDELGLSTGEAAVITSLFGAGILVGAPPGGYLSSRLGGRLTALGACVALIVASILFATASSAPTLAAARFLQGIASGVLWTAALTWVAAIAAPERRGVSLGWLLGVATGGTVVGPVLGAAAEATSVELVFMLLSGVIAVLVVVMWRLPEPGVVREEGNPLALLSAPWRGSLAKAIWTMLVPATGFGVLTVLGPLRLDDLGAGAAVIAATFLVAGVADMLVPPQIGRLVDRWGVDPIVAVGSAVGAVVFALITLPQQVGLLSVTLVCGIGIAAVFGVPASLRFDDLARRARIGSGYAFAIFSLCFAGGQVLGGLLAGALAGDSDDSLPLLVVAAAFAASAAVAGVRAARTRAGAPPSV